MKPLSHSCFMTTHRRRQHLHVHTLMVGLAAVTLSMCCSTSVVSASSQSEPDPDQLNVASSSGAAIEELRKQFDALSMMYNSSYLQLASATQQVMESSDGLLKNSKQLEAVASRLLLSPCPEGQKRGDQSLRCLKLCELGQVAVVSADNQTQVCAPMLSRNAGQTHMCAIMPGGAGAVACWGHAALVGRGPGIHSGSNHLPGLVVAEANAAHGAPYFRGAIQVSAGTDFTCMLKMNGHVFCFGLSGEEQLGRSSNSNMPVEVKDGSGQSLQAIKLSTGGKFGCVLTRQRNVLCWGTNLAGQIGRPLNVFAKTSTPMLIPSPGTSYTQGSWMANVTDIVTGEFHACVIVLENAKVACWGWNQFLSTGFSTPTGSQDIPTYVLAPAGSSGSHLTNVRALAAGHAHSCALVGAQGDVYCWGFSASDQPYHRLLSPSHLPQRVSGVHDTNGVLTGVHSLQEAYRGSFAVLENGNLATWGQFPLYGNGADAATVTPVLTKGVNGTAPALNAVGMVSGGDFFACAAVSSSTSPHVQSIFASGLIVSSAVGSQDFDIVCWGDNGNYQVGDGVRTTDRRKFPLFVDKSWRGLWRE